VLGSVPAHRKNFKNFTTIGFQSSGIPRHLHVQFPQEEKMIVPALRTLLVAALLALPLTAADNPARHSDLPKAPKNHNEATVAQLEAEMASGKLTSEDLTREYIARIIALDQNGPGVNSVIELNPDALEMARNADKLRKRGMVLGPLHGIPVLLKDNRHRRQDANHGGLVCVIRAPGGSRLHGCRQSARRRGGDPGKDEPVGVG
jgi:Amidase